MALSFPRDASIWKKVTASVVIHLTPKDLNCGHAREIAQREAFSSLLMRYSKSLGGVVVAHGRLNFGQDAHAYFDGANPFTKLRARAELLVFAPPKNSVLTGTVTYLGPDHVALSVLSTFHTIIPLVSLPSGYTITDENHMVNRSYTHATLPSITIGTCVRLAVESVSASKNGLFQIRGRAKPRDDESNGSTNGAETMLGVIEESGEDAIDDEGYMDVEEEVLRRYMEGGEGDMVGVKRNDGGEEILDLTGTGVGGFDDALFGSSNADRGDGDDEKMMGGNQEREEGKKEGMESELDVLKGAGAERRSSEGTKQLREKREKRQRRERGKKVAGLPNSRDIRDENKGRLEEATVRACIHENEGKMEGEYGSDNEDKKQTEGSEERRREKAARKEARRQAREQRKRERRAKRQEEKRKRRAGKHKQRTVEADFTGKTSPKDGHRENERGDKVQVGVKAEGKTEVKDPRHVKHFGLQNGVEIHEGEDIKTPVKHEAALDTGKREREKIDDAGISSSHGKKKRKKSSNRRRREG